MADKYVFANSYMAYIDNNPYIYPNDNDDEQTTQQINTGWHIIPNILWRHFATPRQWAEFLIRYEAYHVDSIKIQIFNMIPMTTQLAIQGTNIFTAFNNTIYGMGYTDHLYETSWHNWFSYDDKTDSLNLLYKEGLMCNYGAATKRRFRFPIYQWHLPNSRLTTVNTYDRWDDIPDYTDFVEGKRGGQSGVYPSGIADKNLLRNHVARPTGVIWDPLNRPNDIMELRPGKNTIAFTWSSHPSDAQCWFNLDQMCWWYPYTPEGPYHAERLRPGAAKLAPYTDPDRLATRFEQAPVINDYTVPNWANLPVCPMMWWWQEMRSSILPRPEPNHNGAVDLWRYIDLFFTGTERECYKYGPTQMFLKVIPLFDAQNTHISVSAQVSVRTELTVSAKPRKTAMYAPTWGPFDWRTLYSAKSSSRYYGPNLVRYRTGGMRRTWQNIAGDTVDHPRTTPFTQTTQEQGTGQGTTRSTFTTTMAKSRIRSPQPSAPPMDTDDEPPMQKTTHLYPPLEQISTKLYKI